MCNRGLLFAGISLHRMCTGKGAHGRPGGLRFRRPALRAGFPAMLGRVAPRRNSLRAFQALRSNMSPRDG